MLYFAYGSNMSRRQMRTRCPDHECLGKAVLKDHALCFPRSSPVRLCGVAGVVQQPGAQVWGVVYRLSAADIAALDRREGYDPAKAVAANRYFRLPVEVLMEEHPLACFTYVARPEAGVHLPSEDYLATIIEGASENGLPEDYVAALARLPRAAGTGGGPGHAA